MNELWKFTAALSLSLCIVPAAHAWVFGGNPTVEIWIDRPVGDIERADVTLDEIRVGKCAGGYDTYVIDQELDLASNFALTIAGGDLCSVTAIWGSTASEVERANAGWIVAHDAPSTSVDLVETGASSRKLTPLDVIQGPVEGQFPRLYVDIN